jgi:hypothetical protein
MICLVKDNSGYRVETSLQLSEVQAKLLTQFRIPDNALFIITYTGKELNIGYTDNVGQYGLRLNLEDGSGVVEEDYGVVGYSVTHYANGEVKEEVQIGYEDSTR